MRPRHVILLLSTASAFAQATHAPSDKPKDPFSITIGAPSTVQAGDPIRVHIVYKNTSSEVLPYTAESTPDEGEYQYSVDVWKADGTRATETEYGTRVRLHHYISPGKSGTGVDPGNVVEEDTDITKLFDLSSPGQYEVQVQRPVQVSPEGGVVKSNKITITVAR
jgi:hypothetical protein